MAQPPGTVPSNCRWREEISHGEMAQIKTPKHICASLQCRTLKHIGNTFWHRWRDPQKKGRWMSRPFRVSKFKKSAPSTRALWKWAGPSTLKIVYNNYLSICALNTQTQAMYTPVHMFVCTHVLYVHACVEHIVDTHTFRFCTAKFHSHQFTKVVLEQFHNIVTNVANSYRLPPGPTERERERKAGRKGGREEATHKCYDVGRAAWALCPDATHE